MTSREDLQLAVAAARQAGKYLWKQFREAQTVLCEEGRDIKLQADREAEAIILDMLTTKSQYPLLAEESGEHAGLAGLTADTPRWLVDPLDGTANFSRGIPLCGVSIGLLRGLEPMLGVVYDFNRDELFCGMPGVGAWLHTAMGDAPIHVAEPRPARQSVLVTGLSVRGDLDERVLRRHLRLLPHFKKTRMIGTSALSLAWVATGRFDAYVEYDLNLWDVAGGAALVVAAGGACRLCPAQSHPWACHIRVSSNEAIWEGMDLRDDS